METKYKKNLSLLLIGSKEADKSELINKFLGKKELSKYEDSNSNSNIKYPKKLINDLGIEIIDTQSLDEIDEEDKIIKSILNEIKENKPNVFAFVQNSSEKRLYEPSRKIIIEICKTFNTKSIWNNFIIIFTHASSLSSEKREEYALNFSNTLLKIIKEYYESNNINDNSQLPTKFGYYFVELENEDKNQLDKDTINNLGDIMKLISQKPPMCNTNEKILVEIKIKKKCKETIRKYDIVKKDEYGEIKKAVAGFGGGSVAGLIGDGAAFITVGGLSAIGVTAAAPLLITAGAAWAITSFFTGKKVVKELNKVNFEQKVDDKFQKEDFIIFDEETYIYHDDSTEIKRINVEKFTITIPK